MKFINCQWQLHNNMLGAGRADEVAIRKNVRIFQHLRNVSALNPPGAMFLSRQEH